MRDRRADTVSVLGDPWRKMSELDLRSAGGRARLARASLDSRADPWVKNPGDAPEPEPKRDAGTVKRGKLERKPVVCESCGNESCVCWRPRSPRSLGARCTCDARSPRPSPARLAPRVPVRALSDDEGRSRRLYKSSSQKVLCTSMENETVKKPADPLLETTC